MEPSIFTKIINGDLPAHKIYEDKNTLAFLDIHPVQLGHTVVVPKTQVSFIWDLSAEDYAALMLTVQKVGNRLRDVFPERQRIGVIVEGLGIKDHAHVNVFPFDTPAELRHMPDSTIDPDQQALGALAERLKFDE